MKRHILRLSLVASLVAAAPAYAAAKPSLRDVPEIDNGLLAVGLADEVRKKCENIDARWFTALSYLSSLKNRASDLGYTADEVKQHLKSEDEKARMRKLGAAYVTKAGFDPKKTESLCAFGKEEIKKQTQVGKLLKAK